MYTFLYIKLRSFEQLLKFVEIWYIIYYNAAIAWLWCFGRGVLPKWRGFFIYEGE